jgi:hypothetical protein
LSQRTSWVKDRIFERHTFRIVVLKPVFSSVDIREDLEVVRISDSLAGIYVNEHGHLNFSLSR